MHVLIVTQYFWPENFRINDLAAGLVERGHQVTVLTGIPNYPEGRFFPGYGIFKKSKEEYKGARVLRVPLVPRGNGSGTRLAINYLSFAMSAIVFSPFICRDKYDVIFVFEPSPITVALPAIVLKVMRRIPVILWVQDLWPESLAATGAITSKKILGAVARLVKFIYSKCDRILITSNSFRSSIENYYSSSENIYYFPQSAEDNFQPAVEKVHLPVLDAIPTGFWLMIAGNVGVAQDFPTIIDAAEKLQGHQDIHWIIVGDGRLRQWAESEVENRGLCNNFHFVGRYSLEMMSDFFSYADVMVVTLKKDPIFSLTIPARIQAYLACGKPVIAALDGEGVRVVEASGSGYTCPAEDANALSMAVFRMYQTTKEERKDMGGLGRTYYEATFDRNMLLNRLVVWMNEVVDKNVEGGAL